MGYEFVTCDGCKKRLPVGDASDYKVKCSNCGSIESSNASIDEGSQKDWKKEGVDYEV